MNFKVFSIAIRNAYIADGGNFRGKRIVAAVNSPFSAELFISGEGLQEKVGASKEARWNEIREWIRFPVEYSGLWPGHIESAFCLLSPGIWFLCHFLSTRSLFCPWILGTTFPPGASLAAVEIKIRPNCSNGGKGPFGPWNNLLTFYAHFFSPFLFYSTNVTTGMRKSFPLRVDAKISMLGELRKREYVRNSAL